MIISFLEESVYFGVIISISAYFFGMYLKKKFNSGLLNPLLISIIITIVVVGVGGIDYDKYNQGAKLLSYLLTPATVCLAVPLYQHIELLKSDWKAIIAGIFSGVLTSMLCVLVMAIIFELEHEDYVTLLPKSITTAIGMGVSEELGGYVSITVAIIIITGILGNIIGELVFKLFRISDPVAMGIGLGTASHAIGTAKAMELGEVQGAMSSLSIVISGILTVVGASIFAMIM